jgi:hypothetical protein
MADYKYVQCPNFIVKGARGVPKSIQCKLCGTVIADTVDIVRGYEKSKGGQTIKVVQRQLTYNANYREIKIAFEDPNYFHVTHGCDKCLSLDLPMAVLVELHAADQEESPDGFTERERAQVPVGVVVLQTDQSGIV